MKLLKHTPLALATCISLTLSPLAMAQDTAEQTTQTASSMPVATTQYGQVSGTMKRGVNVFLGIPYGAEANTQTMKGMVDNLPDGAIWAGFGIGRMQMPMVAQAMLLGGHVRVGLEDNLYLDKGVYASNATLVDRAVEIVEKLGGRLQTPAQARDALGLKKQP